VTSLLAITLIPKSLADLALIKFINIPESINISILFLLTFITSIYILSNSSNLFDITLCILYSYKGLFLRVLSNLFLRTRGRFPTLLVLASILFIIWILYIIYKTLSGITSNIVQYILTRLSTSLSLILVPLLYTISILAL
jgi:hypothetical protein